MPKVVLIAEVILTISLSPQMNSLGSSSKWPSYDSLPSTASFPHSESEQTEDEADVFSEGEADNGITKPLSVGEGITLQLHVRSKSGQPEHYPDRTQHSCSASSPGVATLGSSSVTPGDLVFAQKVSTL